MKLTVTDDGNTTRIRVGGDAFTEFYVTGTNRATRLNTLRDLLPGATFDLAVEDDT